MTVSFNVDVRLPAVEALAGYRPTGALRKMAAYFVREMADMFESEGASRGHPWAPLSPRYAAAKARAGRSPKVLHRRGLLRASFLPGGSGHIADLSEDTLVFGSRLARPKPAWHDRGTSRTPERPLLRPIPRDLEELTLLVEEDIAQHILRRGLA